MKRRKRLSEDPFYARCVRYKEDTCKGRVTWEHAFIYAGRQIDEDWAILPICEFHHGVGEYQDRGDLQKELGQFIALDRLRRSGHLLYASTGYPRTDWEQLFKYLKSTYGNYNW